MRGNLLLSTVLSKYSDVIIFFTPFEIVHVSPTSEITQYLQVVDIHAACDLNVI